MVQYNSRSQILRAVNSLLHMFTRGAEVLALEEKLAAKAADLSNFQAVAQAAQLDAEATDARGGILKALSCSLHRFTNSGVLGHSR